MRTLLLILLCICGSFYNIYAQRGFFNKIKGKYGLSNQFTKLDNAEQVFFNPRNAASTFGLNIKADLVLTKAETDKLGITHYRYFQTFHDIPVENAMYIAHTKSGKLLSMGGSIITQFDSHMSQGIRPSVSPPRAITTALHYTQAEKYAWQDANFEQRVKLRKGNSATYYPSPSLVWFGGSEEIDPSHLKLAYKIDVYSLKPLDRKFIYVDAITGKLLGTKQQMMHVDATGTAATGYSGSQTIHSDLKGSEYHLRDLTKGKGIITLHASGNHADYTSKSANWILTGQDQWALDAHYGVAAAWTFYKNVFNRNSIDNAGFALTSWVNDALNPDNAYWDGSEMGFGNISSNGNGVTGIDVTGHELTHGVTQFTCDLVYNKEPGAINESISDIMGKSVQFYTKPEDSSWILSNDMAWEKRNLSNPNAFYQPDTYQGLYWATSSADGYGVHTNSGVGNYMFYLLVKGGSGTNDIGSNYSVSGIGLAKADQIIYRTQTVYLTSTSNYTNWRTACINAATDLYGAASAEVIQVENAWYAVGVGTSGENSCHLAPPKNIFADSVTHNNIKLGWDIVPGANSYILQWKPAAANTFTSDTIFGSTAYNLTGLIPGSYYQVQLATVCGTGGNGIYSIADTIKTTGVSPDAYCTSVGKTFDGITNVTFNTIDNITSATTTGYTDYTATQSTTVIAGDTYTISVKINTGGFFTNYAKAWIDWNQDGVFSTTTEEYDLGSANSVDDGATTLSPLPVTVPAGAVAGSTRMRVSTQYDAAPLPCNASFDGEVEDYSVVVSSSLSDCIIPSGLFSSSIKNTSATVKWAAASQATGYKVQYRITGTSAWTTVSSATNSRVLTNLSAGTSYQFQVAAVCGASGTSAYSASVSFITTGAITTYCASKGTPTYEYIKTVVLGTINHTTVNDGGYGSYINLFTGLSAGKPYTIKLTPGFVSGSYTEYYTVYIDYNKDGNFNGTGETVAKGSGTGTGAKSLNFIVPLTAKNGSTRIRIQMKYGSYSTDPCASLTSGDVHDYTVDITGGVGFNTNEFVAGTVLAGVPGIKVFPNPIAGTTATLTYNLTKEGLVTLVISDMFGRKVQQANFGKQSRGSYTYSTDIIKKLINGNYFIALYQDHELIGRNKVIVFNK